LAVAQFREMGQLPTQWQEAGIKVPEIILGIVKTDKYALVERSELESIIREKFSQGTSLFNSPKEAARLGRLAKADQLLLGTIMFQDNLLLISSRLVDVDSGTISAQEIAEVRKDESLRDRLFLMLRKLKLTD